MIPKFLFGDIVVVDRYHIGVVLKSWVNYEKQKFTYEVYVRSYSCIKEYDECEIDRYRVRHKYLNEEELEYQNTTF